MTTTQLIDTTVLTIGDALAFLTADVPKDRRDACASAALRTLTGRVDIAICRRVSGRPRLCEPYSELGISIAARGGLLLFGFNPIGRVGVDIEAHDSVAEQDAAHLALDHFAPQEARAIAALGTAEHRRDIFLRLWVAKEAVLKLTGRGVFDGLRAPDFTKVLDRLAIDGRIISVSATERLPALELTVCRAKPADRDRTFYCALAIAAA